MRRKIVIILALLATVIALFPVLLAKTPLGNMLLSMVLPKDAVRINIGEMSLSWISNPTLSNVDIRDATGDSLLVAESIHINHSLVSLAFNPRDLGTIQIIRPVLHVKVRPNGSNLEDVIRKLLTASTEKHNLQDARPDKKCAAFGIQLVDATILSDDVSTGRQWRVQNISAEYDTRGVAPDQASLTGEIVVADRGSTPTPAGRFALSLKPSDGGHEQLSVQADRIALAIAEPWLRRFESGSALSGTLSGQATASWTAGNSGLPSDLSTRGALRVDQFDATGAGLHGDHVRLAQVELPWRITAQPTGLAIDEFQLRTDIGQLAIRGQFDPAAVRPPDSKSSTAARLIAGRHDLDMRGAIDIARLVAMLPHTLNIRNGVTITSGTIDITGGLKPTAKGETLTGSVNVARLAGTSRGKALAWDQPINMDVSLRGANGVIALDSLQCNSKFLHIEAAGTLQQFTANAEFDLNALAAQLDQFVDLSNVQLAGNGSARVALQQANSGAFAGNLTGNLAQIHVALGPWQLHGTSDFSANVQLNGTDLEASNAKLVVTDLRAIGPAWNINEPKVEFSGDLRWDVARNEFTTKSAQVVSSTVAFATKDVHYGGGAQQITGAAAFRADLARLAAWRVPSANPVHYVPSGQFTGNVRFVQQAGQITGQITATGQNLALTSVAANTAMQGTNGPGYQTVWQEPQLTLSGATTYDAASDHLSFNQFQIQSNTLQASASGQIQKLSTDAECNVNGTLSYDLAQVTPLLRPYVGTGVKLTGREQARFALAGKLGEDTMPRAQLTSLTSSPDGAATFPASAAASHWSRRIHAQIELPWSGADVYGMQIGPGRLAATLGDGALRIEPLALTIGQGQLTAAPFVRLDPAPAELSLAGGPILTNVHISPEVSEAMLKYMAPVLAGATQSEGLFSLQLDSARVPLADFRNADSAGQLTVHSVRVTPGPMASEWVGLAQQIEALAKRHDPASLTGRQVTLVSIRDQQVVFRVVNGRVYHQNVEFQVGDVTLRSQGSVGFDQTIALTLEIPIQDAWVAKEPLLSGLKGQSLQVPVTGTLTHPKMDQRAITRLSAQLIQNGAGQALGNELNKALDKFRKPR
ncbi:MAG TPA: hypothetical protein VFW73_00360 [Lacipirellulaceae bacterium]|nr:hypothetical protein [Lacipirellulaceae bacterium]